MIEVMLSRYDECNISIVFYVYLPVLLTSAINIG